MKEQSEVADVGVDSEGERQKTEGTCTRRKEKQWRPRKKEKRESGR